MKCAILTIDPFKYLYFLILHAADLHQSHEDASCSEHARQRVAKMDRLLLLRTPGCSLYGSIQVAPVSWIDGHPCGCWPSRTSGAADVSWRPLFDSVAGSFSVPVDVGHRTSERAAWTSSKSSFGMLPMTYESSHPFPSTAAVTFSVLFDEITVVTAGSRECCTGPSWLETVT